MSPNLAPSARRVGHDTDSAAHSGETAHDLVCLQFYKPAPSRAGRSARAFALLSRRNGS
jgi:hypothetical protein